MSILLFFFPSRLARQSQIRTIFATRCDIHPLSEKSVISKKRREMGLQLFVRHKRGFVCSCCNTLVFLLPNVFALCERAAITVASCLQITPYTSNKWPRTCFVIQTQVFSLKNITRSIYSFIFFLLSVLVTQTPETRLMFYKELVAVKLTLQCGLVPRVNPAYLPSTDQQTLVALRHVACRVT